jgi:hypothetical protein
MRRRDLGLADVHADRHVGAVLGQPGGECGGSVVVEAHPVEQRPVVRQPEEPRGRVTRLRARGDGADLGVAETQCAPGIEARSVFVEAGGQAQRSGKMHAEHRAAQYRVDRCQPATQLPTQRRCGGGAAEPGEHDAMDAFGGHQEQQTAQG